MFNDEIKWHFGIGTKMPPVYMHNTPSVVTPENCEVWRVYLENLIQQAITEESMDTPEFRQAAIQLRERHEREVRWRQAREQRVERNRRCSAMRRPKVAYIPKWLTVDYEVEYAELLQEEVTFIPTDIADYRVQRKLIERWVVKSVPQILKMNRPDAAYAIAISVCRSLPAFLQREDLKAYHATDKAKLRKLILASFSSLVESVTAWNHEEKRRCVADFISEQAELYAEYRGLPKLLLGLIPTMPFVGDVIIPQREKSDDELRQEAEEELQLKIETQRRIEEEHEDRSIIPINNDIESRIFTNYVMGEDGDLLNFSFCAEFNTVDWFLQNGQQQQAALYAMQLVKSLCRHFIQDEHWCYFDDLYSPDYSVDELMKRFE